MHYKNFTAFIIKIFRLSMKSLRGKTVNIYTCRKVLSFVIHNREGSYSCLKIVHYWVNSVLIFSTIEVEQLTKNIIVSFISNI